MKKKQGEVAAFAPPTDWPVEWKTVTSKVYERFPLIPLARPRQTNVRATGLYTALGGRRSRRVFNHAVTEPMLADLLYYSLGEQPGAAPGEVPKRMCPSAGGLYPLEAYLLLLRPVGAFVPGVYHYDVPAHGLRKIRDGILTKELLASATAETYAAEATGALVLTALPARSYLKYGERTYKFMLLEAGAIFQNAALVAEELGLASVQVSTFAEDVIEPLLDIDGRHETYLHALFFG